MSDELVCFEPAKNNKFSVVIGGVSFLCDSKREGLDKAISVLLMESVRLHNLKGNYVQQLNNINSRLREVESLAVIKDLAASLKQLHSVDRHNDDCRFCRAWKRAYEFLQEDGAIRKAEEGQ